MHILLVLLLTAVLLLAARALWCHLTRPRPLMIARAGFIPADGGPETMIDFDPPVPAGKAIGLTLMESYRRRQAH